MTTKKQVMINYLLLNVDEEDWHGVWDAAIDLDRMVANGTADEPLSINMGDLGRVSASEDESLSNCS